MDTLLTDLVTNAAGAAGHAPIPSVNSTFHEKPRVLIASFGAGYEQRTGDGPTGNLLRDWSLIWDNIPRVHVKSLTDFFRAQAGKKKFQWTQLIPYDGEGVKAYICEEWTVAYLGGDTQRFTALLLERPPV